MSPELSIIAKDDKDVLATVIVDDRRWTMSYGGAQAALVAAVALGLVKDSKSHIAEYEAEPAGWSLFAKLPPDFDPSILISHGWTLEPEYGAQV